MEDVNAFENNGLVPTVGFDYEAVEGAGQDYERYSDLNVVMSRMVDWLLCVEDGKPTAKGQTVHLRVHVLAWVTKPELFKSNLTELAQKLGVHKQSLSRVAQQFVKAFGITNEHMKGNDESAN